MILIGNSATLKKSNKGGETWDPFLNFMAKNGHLYNGLPVKCERHPHRLSLLKIVEDFESQCPDGGCSEPWYVAM